jgi:hypothetical protein
MPVSVTSSGPISEAEFWIRYSNLLLSVWAIPSVKAQLHTDPAGLLSYFDLATPPNATVTVNTSINPSNPNFTGQYGLWMQGHQTRTYTLYVPDQHPGDLQLWNSADSALRVATTSDCCCCCCPCCSCF